MQLGIFQPQQLHKDVSELAHEIVKINVNSLIVFCGSVPRPLDHHRSQSNCVSFNKALQNTVTHLQQHSLINCVYLDVYSGFIDTQGAIISPHVNFQDELYLTEAGIRVLHAM